MVGLILLFCPVLHDNWTFFPSLSSQKLLLNQKDVKELHLHFDKFMETVSNI